MAVPAVVPAVVAVAVPAVVPAAVAAAVSAAAQGGITLVPRSKAEVERFLEGLEPVEPGIVPMVAWHPDEEPKDPTAAWYWAGVARKP